MSGAIVSNGSRTDIVSAFRIPCVASVHVDSCAVGPAVGPRPRVRSSTRAERQSRSFAMRSSSSMRFPLTIRADSCCFIVICAASKDALHSLMQVGIGSWPPRVKAKETFEFQMMPF